jgi:hypothetical protein
MLDQLGQLQHTRAFVNRVPMRRLGLAIVLILSLTLTSLGTAAAQHPEKVPPVGYLNPGSASDPLRQRRLDAFRHGLRELGCGIGSWGTSV